MAGSGEMQDIKRRVRSVTSIEHITNAMRLVSSAKLRRAKSTFEGAQEYFHYVIDSIQEIFHNSSEIPQKYLRQEDREIKNTCYIIVTSNRGLAGSFNTNVIKEAERIMNSNRDGSYIVAIGSKGKEYFSKRGYEIIAEYMRPPENISFLESHQISSPIIDLYNQEKIDEVVIIHTSFISSLEQRVISETLLPFDAVHDPNILSYEKQVEYEPSTEEVFNYLVPKFVEIMIYGSIIESATCEHASRRIAMENATDNAKSMIDDLNLFYNRARQAAITSEITEIVSGADALK